MFEAVVTLCLAADPGACRVTLLPGHEAATEAACAAGLGTFAAPPGTLARGAPSCREAPEGLPFEEVAPGLFVHLGRIEEPGPANGGDVANIAFVIGGESVAVIDAGLTRAVAEDAWRAIRARTALPVSHLILTHVHPDHALGAPLFAEAGAEVVGHAALPRSLAERAANYAESLSREIGPAAALGSGAAAVDRTVDGEAEVDLGGRVLALRAWPLAHTGTDLSVLDASTGTLLAGDLVFDGHVPALDGSVTGWLAVLEELAALPAGRVVPGHGGPVLDWPDGAAPTRRYLEVLAADTRAAIARGDRLSEAAATVAASEAGEWRLFGAFNARNATVAFAELEWE